MYVEIRRRVTITHSLCTIGIVNAISLLSFSQRQTFLSILLLFLSFFFSFLFPLPSLSLNASLRPFSHPFRFTAPRTERTKETTNYREPSKRCVASVTNLLTRNIKPETRRLSSEKEREREREKDGAAAQVKAKQDVYTPVLVNLRLGYCRHGGTSLSTRVAFF